MSETRVPDGGRARLVEQILVKLDEETYGRIERLARAIERSDPTHRQISRAAVVRACVVRVLAEIESEVHTPAVDEHGRP